jgi:hypothetical protein
MQQPVKAPPAPAPKKNRRLSSLLGIAGIILAVLILVVIAIPIIIGHIQSSQPQQVTTGRHITKIQTGTGFDQKKAQVQGQSGSFQASQAVYVVFTVVNQDPKAQVVVKLFAGNTLQNTSDTLNPDVGTAVYSDLAIIYQSGSYRWEVDYNGAVEASITFNVSG